MLPNSVSVTSHASLGKGYQTSFYVGGLPASKEKVVLNSCLLNSSCQQPVLNEASSFFNKKYPSHNCKVWHCIGAGGKYTVPDQSLFSVTARRVDLHRKPIQHSASGRLLLKKPGLEKISSNSSVDPRTFVGSQQRRHILPVTSDLQCGEAFRIKVRFVSHLSSYRRMGQTLSEPVTKKETSSDENHSLKVGTSCMQGWRINMEDEHVHKLCLNDEKDTHFFAVFDGHGGQVSAQYAAKHLDNCILSHNAYRRSDIAAACKAGFLNLDEQLNKECVAKDDGSGCTAVAALLKGNKVYCANVGDSRAVASVRGHAQLLSFDHKPHHDREMRRINAAGGFVEFNRVNGNLALSRAFGDFVFKKNENRRVEEQIVSDLWAVDVVVAVDGENLTLRCDRLVATVNGQNKTNVHDYANVRNISQARMAEPDVITKEITKDHEFLVLACDGIWDVLNNQDVVEFVRERLAKHMEPELICEELMDRCLASECAVGGVGCDNMTVIIVALKQNGSFDELCRKCAVPKRDPIPPCCLLSSYPDYVKGSISCL